MAQPQKRYAEEFKRDVVARMNAAPDDITSLARELGLSRSQLYRWRKQYTAPLVSPRPEGEGHGVRAVGADQSDAQTLTAQNERLRQTLLDTAFALAGAIRATTESAPLNQLSAALGLVIDRLLKLEALTPGSTIAPSEEVIRIEYLDQDGAVHDTPPWARDDPAFEGTVSRGRVRSPFWQNRDGQADDPGDGPARG